MRGSRQDDSRRRGASAAAVSHSPSASLNPRQPTAWRMRASCLPCIVNLINVLTVFSIPDSILIF